MQEFIWFLKNRKRYWVPPILLMLAAILYLAWKAAQRPGAPIDYTPF